MAYYGTGYEKAIWRAKVKRSKFHEKTIDLSRKRDII